jgi:Flp pilus assembly protein TadD
VRAGIPIRKKTSLASPFPKDLRMMCTPGTGAGWNCSAGAAAAQVLQRASTAEPQARSVREALARAQFDAGRYAEAADNFRLIVEASPSDDYANFGLGLALARTGNHAAAAEYLALAAAMRPDEAHYTEALRSVRATLQARKDQGARKSKGGSE